MKKNKKLFISFVIILIIVVVAVLLIINALKDRNRLTILEKQWINNNSKIVFNIGVKNNVNVFGQDGIGVFYDFIEDFSKEYNLTINPTTYTNNESTEKIAFRTTTELDEKDLVLYQDHFVLVSKNSFSLNGIDNLDNRKIGLLSEHLNLISNYLKGVNSLSLVQYDEKEQLLNEFDKQEDIKYILVPLNEYLDVAVAEGNFINLHISDIPIYYTLYENGGDKNLESILKKYYNGWMKSNFDFYYNKEAFEFITNVLKFNDEAKDKLHSKTYSYGFIENSPYETLSGNNYGGIISVYLEKFKDFSGIDIKYTRYRNKKSFVNAINKKDIELFYNFYNIDTDFTNIATLMNVNYYVIMPDNNNRVINNLISLSNDDIYVLEGSFLEQYLSGLKYLNVKTYKDYKDLIKTVKDNKIIAIDKYSFDYLNNNKIKNYSVRYSDTINNTYTFNSNATVSFNTLFSKYINILDNNTIINEGLYSNKIVVKSGTIMGTVARYILYIISIGIIVILFAYKSSKKIKIAKRIKKEDKMRFIDQLTSVKNRNYLSENIESWNKNTIYPQTLLVIDINSIQYINDTYGYENGDKQIKAAANALIKLQLDNSDIIRTDGTEFLVYLVGYSEKQVANYMRKLNKEFKKLPYDYGVVMAYSSITDDIKTIEDAINEATLAIKEKKNEKESLQSED